MASPSLMLWASAALRSGKALRSPGSRRLRWARLPGSTRNRAANDLAIVLTQQVVEFGMLSHERSDERAARHDLQVLGAGHLQHAPHQPRGDAPAAQRRGHLGVGEGDHAGREAVIGDRGAVAGVHLEAVLGLVVADDVRHAGPESPSISTARQCTIRYAPEDADVGGGSSGANV